MSEASADEAAEHGFELLFSLLEAGKGGRGIGMMDSTKIVMVPIEDIHPYEINPLNNDLSVERVRNSLRRFGFKQPLLLDKDSIIVVGHTRYRAAMELGYKKLPCIFSELSDEENKAYRLADNKTAEASTWDEAKLDEELAGISDIDMEDFGFDVDDMDGIDDDAEQGKSGSLIDQFVVPPFSVLDTRQGYWQKRKNAWIDRGLSSQNGREDSLLGQGLLELARKSGSNLTGTSIFDPVLCEIMYRWFCPENGKVVDCFAGGSVRGIVAAMLGLEYTGIDLRQEQIDENHKNAEQMGVHPAWYCDDSLNIDRYVEDDSADMILSCPPYGDLEKYSDDPRDLSNMKYCDFMKVYRQIIERTCKKLKRGRFAVFVVGDIRDKDGYYRDFIADTNRAFKDCGMELYNQFILLEQVATAAVRACRQFNAMRKVCKTHQNVQVYYKGDVKDIKANFPPINFSRIDDETLE